MGGFTATSQLKTPTINTPFYNYCYNMLGKGTSVSVQHVVSSGLIVVMTQD